MKKILPLLFASFCFSAHGAMDVSGIKFCQILHNKAEMTARAKTQGISKVRFIKEARIADDAEDYSQDFYKMELAMIDDTYKNPTLTHSSDNYENIKKSSQYGLDVLDRCLQRYGKTDHVIFN